MTTEKQATNGEVSYGRDDISDKIYIGAGVSKERAPETEPIMILPATADPQEWAEENPMVRAHYSRSAYNGAGCSDRFGALGADIFKRGEEATSHRNRGTIF